MGIKYTIQKTEHNGHAIEIVKELNIYNYVAIGVLSGDGMVSEVSNGLLRRPDFKRALKVPLIHLPLGLFKYDFG